MEAILAQNLARHNEIWDRREAAAEVTFSQKPLFNNDNAYLWTNCEFIDTTQYCFEALNSGIEPVCVAHLCNGNANYAVWPKSQNPVVHEKILETSQEIVLSLQESFSA